MIGARRSRTFRIAVGLPRLYLHGRNDLPQRGGRGFPSAEKSFG